MNIYMYIKISFNSLSSLLNTLTIFYLSITTKYKLSVPISKQFIIVLNQVPIVVFFCNRIELQSSLAFAEQP